MRRRILTKALMQDLDSIKPDGWMFRQYDIELTAIARDCDVKDICTMCLKQIKVMAFRSTGACSENCRKSRDNDLMPARTTV